MNKTDKQTVVKDLTARLEQSVNLYVTDFTGITVKRMTEMRRRFRAEGLDYMVVKNTLARRALADASVEGLEHVLVGPTGFVFAGSDAVAAAKILTEFQRDGEDRPAVKAGLVDGRPVGPDEVKRLATLPTREQLMGQLAGAMQAPLQGLLGAFNGLLYQFAGVLDSLRAQRENAA